MNSPEEEKRDYLRSGKLIVSGELDKLCKEHGLTPAGKNRWKARDGKHLESLPKSIRECVEDFDQNPDKSVILKMVTISPATRKQIKAML